LPEVLAGSLDSLAPLLEERGEHEEQEVLELTAA